jgi:hypothetical protein
MAKKQSIDELATEILQDFEAGDTPARRAQAALDQARDAGESGLRLQHLREAQHQIAAIDPARDPRAIQRLQARVLALQGRGGDTEIAHVTPGELVIPGWMQTPEVMRVLAAMAEQAGLDPAASASAAAGTPSTRGLGRWSLRNLTDQAGQ